jgi:DNA polymerase-3 subunit delta'
VPLVNESQRGELEAVRNRRPASSTIASIEAIALVRRRLTANVPPQLALEELLIGYAVG